MRLRAPAALIGKSRFHGGFQPGQRANPSHELVDSLVPVGLLTVIRTSVDLASREPKFKHTEFDPHTEVGNSSKKRNKPPLKPYATTKLTSEQWDGRQSAPSMTSKSIIEDPKDDIRQSWTTEPPPERYIAVPTSPGFFCPVVGRPGNLLCRCGWTTS